MKKLFFLLLFLPLLARGAAISELPIFTTMGTNDGFVAVTLPTNDISDGIMSLSNVVNLIQGNWIKRTGGAGNNNTLTNLAVEGGFRYGDALLLTNLAGNGGGSVGNIPILGVGDAPTPGDFGYDSLGFTYDVIQSLLHVVNQTNSGTLDVLGTLTTYGNLNASVGATIAGLTATENSSFQAGLKFPNLTASRLALFSGAQYLSNSIYSEQTLADLQAATNALTAAVANTNKYVLVSGGLYTNGQSFNETNNGLTIKEPVGSAGVVLTVLDTNLIAAVQVPTNTHGALVMGTNANSWTTFTNSPGLMTLATSNSGVSAIYQTTRGVGFGTNAPQSTIHAMSGGSALTAVTAETSNSTSIFSAGPSLFRLANSATNAGNWIRMDFMAPSLDGTIHVAGTIGMQCIDKAASTSTTGDVVIATSAGASPTEKFRVKSGGQVGVGTTNPTATLHITNATAEVKMQVSQRILNTNDIATFDAGGNVILDIQTNLVFVPTNLAVLGTTTNTGAINNAGPVTNFNTVQNSGFTLLTGGTNNGALTNGGKLLVTGVTLLGTNTPAATGTGSTNFIIDCSLANVFFVNPVANFKLWVTNSLPGWQGWIIMTQDGSGSRTMVYDNSNIKTNANIAPSTAANTVDRYDLRADSKGTNVEMVVLKAFQ